MHDLEINAGAFEVLAAVDEPLERGDDDNDGEGHDTVICRRTVRALRQRSIGRKRLRG